MDLKDELANFAVDYKDQPSDNEDPYARQLKLKAQQQKAHGHGGIGKASAPMNGGSGVKKAHPLAPSGKKGAHPLAPSGKKLGGLKDTDSEIEPSQSLGVPVPMNASHGLGAQGFGSEKERELRHLEAQAKKLQHRAKQLTEESGKYRAEGRALRDK